MSSFFRFLGAAATFALAGALLAQSLSNPGSPARQAVPPAPAETRPLTAPGAGNTTLLEQRLVQVAAREQRLWERLGDQPSAEALAAAERTAQELAQEYEALLAIAPDRLELLVLYGKFLRKVDQEAYAHQLFTRALRIDPKVAVVRQQLGNYLVETEKWPEALGMFLAAVELAPNEAVYHYQLGEVLAQGRRDLLAAGILTETDLERQMLTALGTAARLAPTNVDYAYRYAEAFDDVRQPDWAAALTLWEALARRADLSALQQEAATLQAARVLVRLGRLDEARGRVATVTSPALQANRQQVLDSLATAGAPAPNP